MTSRLEVDLRWVFVFASSLVIILVRNKPIALMVMIGLFWGGIGSYWFFGRRWLARKTSDFQGQLVAFLSAHEDERAASLIEQQMALTLWGRRHVVESARGLLAMSRKALDEAHGHFTQALTAAPRAQRFSIEINLVNIEAELGHTESAVARCRSLLAQRPDSALVRSKLAQLLLDDLGD